MNRRPDSLVRPGEPQDPDTALPTATDKGTMTCDVDA